jgi:drug/metabolite transporter superfamily protein YnfA
VPCMTKLHRVSPILEARVAGGIYLLSIVMLLISSEMQALGDQANLVAGILYTGMTLLLWHLLWPVDKWLATGAAMISLLGCWAPLAWFKAAHTTNFLFFGLCCLAIGYLIVRSRFLPNVFGVLMACAGLAWLVTTFPWLAHTIAPFPVIVGLIGEGALMGYLLVKGLDERPVGGLTGGGVRLGAGTAWTAFALW